MKLEARSRLKAAGHQWAVTQFLDYIGRLCAGQVRKVSSPNDCRVTVANYLLTHPSSDQDEIIVVGFNDGDFPHAVHVFLASPQGQILADSYGGKWGGGYYQCSVNGEPDTLVPLIKITVAAFKVKYVEPYLHGHVVARSDGCRTKCGGPNSVALRCQVCAREAELLANGRHPLQARRPFADLPYKVEGLKFGFHSEEMMQRFLNWLGAARWCGDVGHSATIAMFVDGDGADQMRIEGPGVEKLLKLGGEMAQGGSDNGDGLMLEIGHTSALGYYTVRPDAPDATAYKRIVAYPPSKEGDD
jgi:hypothetical protein